MFVYVQRTEEFFMKMMDANEIISYIANSKKTTPVKVYLKGDLEAINFGENAKDFY